MQVIQIGTGTHDQTEFRESAPARGSSGAIGGQISRDDVRGQPRYHRAKISTAPQVGGLIDNLGRVALEVRITACGVLGGGTGRVAAVAVADRVDEVAAEANQSRV